MWVQALGRKDPLEKEIQATPVFLPGESHGQKSLAGYSPRGHKESDTTERLHTHTYINNYLKCKWEIILQVKDRDYWHASQRKTQAYSIHNRKQLNIKDTI